MYLDRVKAKGRQYLYLKMYDTEVTYSKDKRVVLYRFGREEKALQNMYLWLSDINKMPVELKELNCNKDDLKKWIYQLEIRMKRKDIA